MADRTFHFVPPQPWEVAACAAGGVTLSQLRFFLSFVLSVAAGAALRAMPTVRARHWFSLVSGVALIAYPFGAGCLHAFVPALLVYACMAWWRARCGTAAWAIAFPYLILQHVLQASGAAWKEGHLDFTGAQMVLTLRIIAVAVSYQDGARPAGALQGYAAQKALAGLPSPLEYLSYLFAAGNLLAGPFYEARDFLDYVRRQAAWDVRDPAKRIPSPLLPGLLRFGKGLLCAAAWLKLSAPYNADLLEGRWFQTEASLGQRCFYLWLVGLAARCKYYFAWAIAESALIFSGLCYNGRDAKTGRPLWNRYVNARIRRVEFNPSLPNLAANWNVCTGHWLRHYVYDRLTPAGRRPGFGTLVATQLVSGVWHGLFPGYWLFFATSAIMFEAGKTLYRYEQAWPPRVRAFKPYIALKVASNALVLNYAASAFIVLWLHDSLAIWRSVHFLGHAACLATIFLGSVCPPRKPPREHRPERAAPLKAGAADAAAAAAAVAAVAADGDGAGAAAAGAAEGKKEL